VSRRVSLEGVSVEYGEVRALSGVSLSVDPGEFFTLVGPSGCGKTTTLRLVAGLESPSGGRVHIGDEDVTPLPPERRNVGIVFQNYALFAHMTVRENVAYGLRFRDTGTPRRERVDELLSLVDLEGMGERDPTELSGGQKQRVALARALAPAPDVLLLDEPLSALDAELRERLRLRVREIQRELGITTIYVTHDQAEALAISDRVAVMNDGRIEQVDTPERLYNRPRTRFVASFVGDNNLFEAAVVGSDPLRVRLGDHEFVLPDAALLDAGFRVTPSERVTVGVRPESIRTGAGDVTLEAEIEHVEFLGDAYRLHCAWGDERVLVKTDRPAEGRIDLGFDAESVTLVEAGPRGPFDGDGHSGGEGPR
jgi:thiamine transport system ATP-binding protein